MGDRRAADVASTRDAPIPLDALADRATPPDLGVGTDVATPGDASDATPSAATADAPTSSAADAGDTDAAADVAAATDAPDGPAAAVDTPGDTNAAELGPIALDAPGDGADDAASAASSDGPLDTAADLAVDAASDGATDAPVTTFYMGPNGDDSNPGTLALPWKTWTKALSELHLGETLVLLDGDYGVSTGAGLMHVACGAGATACGGSPCRHGQSAKPITVKALNERRARLLHPMGGTGNSLTVEQCRHWEFEGLHIEGADDMAGAQSIAIVDRGLGMVIRRSVFRRDNRYKNSMLLDVRNSTNVLILENEFFQGHRNAITIWYSSNVVLMRNFINGGDGSMGTATADLPGGYASHYNCPTDTDTGIDFWGSVGGILENNVIEGACRAIAVFTDTSEPGSAGAGDGTRVLGNIGKDNSFASFTVESSCGHTTPCIADNRVVTGAQLVDNVSVNSDVGVDSLGAVGLSVRHQSALGYTIAGIRLRRSAMNAGLSASATILDSQVVGNSSTIGFSVRNHATWLIHRSNAFSNDVAYDPNDASVTMSTTVNPQLGACKVEIPVGSPLKGAASDGRDIGATIRYRYEDGLLTTKPLWDTTTGQFPCGTIVPGVNDEATFPGGSCATFHTRIGITAGCGRP
jgi:hypothetical protein